MKYSIQVFTAFKTTLLFCIFSSTSFAEVYIDLDFEKLDTGLSPVSDKGYPLWTLPPAFDSNFGPGNLFEISDSTSHSGNHSLRFVYEGSNGICNTCGTRNVTHKKDLNGVNYIVADDGQDLTQEFYPPQFIDPNDESKGTFTAPGPHASVGKLVYNKSRGNAMWRVVSVGTDTSPNDKLNLELVRPGIGAFKDQPAVFNSKDSVSIARQCGVDGTVGKSGGQFIVDRRSDCDAGIVWFAKTYDDRLDQDKIQASGSSIFRRVYIKSEIVGPPSGHKLNYMKLAGAELILIADFVNDGIEPQLTGLGKIGGKGIYKPGTNLPTGIKLERGVWYYIEQEYKSETYTVGSVDVDSKGTVSVTNYVGNGDGEYRLWFAKSGESTIGTPPIIQETGLGLPPMLGGKGPHMSLWGNEGHSLHARGSWYMDDIVISDARIGPMATPVGLNTAPPRAPLASKN